VLVLSATAAAQSAEPKVTGTVSNITRVESWSYFQPRVDILAPTEQPIGEPDYTFFGDRAELGVRVNGPRFELGGAFNYVRLENLPTNAIGPGGLGTGAFYFAATGVSYSYQLYFGELTLKTKFSDGTSLTVRADSGTQVQALSLAGAAGVGVSSSSSFGLNGAGAVAINEVSGTNQALVTVKRTPVVRREAQRRPNARAARERCVFQRPLVRDRRLQQPCWFLCQFNTTLSPTLTPLQAPVYFHFCFL